MKTPPASLLLVHGAGSGPWVFAGWPSAFPGLTVSAVDPQQRLDVATASMRDYAAAVERAARHVPAPVALCGWSMGGLVVLMAAHAVEPHSIVLLEPSPPAEVQGFHPGIAPGWGSYDPEDVYGPFPPGQRARPESRRARDERKRGISVPSLPCPSLVVYTDQHRDIRGRAVAALYGSAEAHFSGLDHWGLVLDPAVRSAIARFLGTKSA